MKKIYICLVVLIGFFSNGTCANNFTDQQCQSGFIENKGQIIDQNGKVATSVKFLYNSKNLNVQLRNNGFSYDTYETVKHQSKYKLHKELGIEKDSFVYNFHRIDIDLVNSNLSPEITASNASTDYLNYYTYGTSEQGVINVKMYKRILYKNIYPHIDLEFVIGGESASMVKYNFIINPGGNPDQIEWKYKGALSTQLKNGKIELSTSNGKLAETIPYSYTVDSGKEVNVEFLIKSEGTYGVRVNGYYDHSKVLIIDPVPDLMWATYYGGSGNEGASGNGAVRTDNQGNVYISSDTQSPNNIASVGAHQVSLSGVQDVFLAKFNSSGVRQWATFYGGSQNEYQYGEGLCTDQSDNVYICGYTTSTTNIATAGAYDITYAGSCNTFIAKFNPNGVRQWGTYYGTSQEIGCSMVTDGVNYLYVSGRTTGTNNTLGTPGTYKPTTLGGTEVFLVKFNLAGTTRIWGTYMGGNSQQRSYLAYDPSGFVYVYAPTPATNGMSSPGCHQATFGGGTWDMFLAKMDASNGTRVWSTYYGGTTDETDGGVTVGPNGNVYISGGTRSTTNISTVGAHQATWSGSDDGFLVCFNSNGVRQWGTYFGGTSSDQVGGLGSDPSGMLYLAGRGYSSTGIATPGAYQTVPAGGDAFVSKFDPSGTQVWGTYYNGGGDAFSVSTNGIYVYALTRTASATATPGAHQVTPGGSADLFLMKFDGACSAPTQPGAISGPTIICENSTNIYSISAVAGASSYTWTLPNGWTGTSITTSINATANATSGNITVTATNACGTSTTQTLSVTVNSIYSVNTTAAICQNDSILLGGAYQKIAGSYMDMLQSINGCDSMVTTALTINPLPTITTTGDTAICAGGTATLTAYGASSYTWQPGNLSGSMIMVSPSQLTTYVVEGTDQNGCKNTSIIVVTVNPIPTVTLGAFTAVCADAAAFALTGGLPAGGTYSGAGVNNNQFDATVAGAGTHTITYTYTDGNTGCSNSATNTIVVNPLPPTPIITVNGTTFTSSAANGNQWYLNGNPINGATNQTFVCTVNGNYAVCVTDANGCKSCSAVLNFTTFGISENINGNEINIYPNPFSSTITITASEQSLLRIYNVLGEEIYYMRTTNRQTMVDLITVPKGVYFVKVSTQGENVIRKIVKE